MPYRTRRMTARFAVATLAFFFLLFLPRPSHGVVSGPVDEGAPPVKSSDLADPPADDPNPEAACGSAPQIAGELWQEYDRRTKEAGCYIDWKPSSMERYGACLREYSKIPAQLGEKLVGFWNTMAKNEWATIGPRRIEPGKNRGTLASPGNRLWLTSTPKFMEDVSIRLEKRKAKKLLGVPLNTRVEVSVCSTGPAGETEVIHQEDVLAKEDAGTVIDESFTDPEPGVLSVYLRSKAKVPLTFKYILEVEHEPKKYYAGEVDGFADIHVHQMADLAYGGTWYWGDHAAMEEELRACVPMEPDSRVTDPLKVARRYAQGEGGLQKAGLVGEPSGDPPEALTKELQFYTHAIPDVFPPDHHLNIVHGEPAPASLEGWPRFDDIAHQQVNAEWLKQAHDRGLDLIVVSAVNFQAVCKAMRFVLGERAPDQKYCNDLDNVEDQLEAAQEMEKKYDWYEIAVHPWHARKIIDEGKLAVVLSMEVSNLFPKGRHDFVWQLERLREMGLRTLQLAHETNSRFAGAAPHKDLFEAFEHLKHPFRGPKGDKFGFDYDDEGKNVMGLTDEGRRLVDVLMDRHMPIDIAHLSEKSVRQLHGMAMDRGGFPLYDSHTRPKGILTAKKKDEQQEFLTTCEQARFIEQTGGMVGLRTGDTEMLTHVEPEDPSKAYEGNTLRPTVENTCPGSSRSFAQMVEFTADNTGLDMAFGSDFNGFITQLGPRFGPEACHRVKGAERLTYARLQSQKYEASDAYHRVGLSHIGYLPDLLADLEGIGYGVDTRRLESSAEAFLDMWERAWDEERQPLEAETTCPGWSGAETEMRLRRGHHPDPVREVNGLLEVDVEGVRGPEKTIDDFSSGKAIAGAFLNEVAFEPRLTQRGSTIQAVRLRRAEYDSDGFLDARDSLRPYEPGTTITEPGLYALEVYGLDSEDRTLIGHLFFRVVPNADEIRSAVDYQLAGAQSVVTYDWDSDRDRFVFTHDRGTQGTGTGQSWTFKGALTPEVTSDDRSAVQQFHLRLDGEPIENRKTFLQGAEAGEHTLAIYACYNVLAGDCETTAGTGWAAAEEDEEPRRRYEKKKKKKRRQGPTKEATEATAPGPLPPGMVLIARHTIQLEAGLEFDTPVDTPVDRPPVDVGPAVQPAPGAIPGNAAPPSDAFDGGGSVELERGTNRPGSDIRSGFDVEDPEACLEACRDDPDCRSFTFVEAGIQAEHAMCWVKDGIPEARPADGMVSGVVRPN